MEATALRLGPGPGAREKKRLLAHPDSHRGLEQLGLACRSPTPIASITASAVRATAADLISLSRVPQLDLVVEGTSMPSGVASRPAGPPSNQSPARHLLATPDSSDTACRSAGLARETMPAKAVYVATVGLCQPPALVMI